MGCVISVIKKCATFLTLKATKQVTQALILSNLDYCPAVWSNAKADMIRKLQMIQNRAVLHCNYGTNIVSMHKSLNWLLVKDRCYIHYQYLLEITLLQRLHTFCIRHAVAGNFTLPKTKTKAIKRTVMYRAMYEWNSLPRNITQESR